MDWHELLHHPFWTQIVNEEEDVEEGGDKDEEGDQEEKNCLEGGSPASLRCVALSLFLFSFQLLQQSAYIMRLPVGSIHILFCKREIMQVSVDTVLFKPSLASFNLLREAKHFEITVNMMI